MKLRLPHRFLAALLAAIASVSFTTLSTGTLGAAVFTLAGYQAAGEETETATAASGQQNLSGDYEAAEEAADRELSKAAGPTDEEREAEDKLNEELEDNARMVEEKEEEQERETTTDSMDEEAVGKALGSINSSGGGAAGLLPAMLGADSVESETAAPVAAPAQQGTTAATGTLPSNDLGFTTDVNGNTASSLAKAAAAAPTTALMSAAPAADNVQTSLAQADTAGTASTGHPPTLSTAQPAYNGYYGGTYSGPSISPVAMTATPPALLGATGDEPTTTDEPDQPAGYPNVITTTFENANQASIGRVTLHNTFASAAGGTVPIGGITSLTDASGANLGVKINGTAGSDASFLSPNADVQNNAWTMVMTFSGAEVVQSMTGITLTVGLFNSDGNWLTRAVSMNGDVTFTATVAAAVGGTGLSYDFTGSLFGGQEGPHRGQGADKFTVNLTGEALNMNAAVTDATITLTLTSTLDHSCYIGLQDIEYNVTTVPFSEHDLFWKGGAGVWDKETKNWNIVSGDGSYQPVAFKNGDNIYFYQPGVSSLDLTEQALTAGNVYVDHGVHVQLSAVDGALLTANNVDVLGDITVTDVAINAKTLNIEEGSTVTANTTGDRTGYLTPNLYGDGTFVKDGSGTLRLTGDNSDFEGGFVIKNGTLAVDKDSTNALGVNPDVTLAGDGAELAGNLNASGENIRITSTANGTVSSNITASDTATLTFDTHEGSVLTASGTLAGNIYKDGDGTLVITGDNSSAAGEFFINQGRVEAIDGTKSLGDGTVHVDSDATLALTDTDGVYAITGLDLDFGSTIVLPGVAATPDKIQLHLGHMFLHTNASLTLNPESQALFESLKNLQPGQTASFYLADYESATVSEAGSIVSDEYETGLVQFVYLSGLEKTGLRPDYFITLRVDTGNKQVLGKVEGPRAGVYWDPSSTPDAEGKLYWDTTSSNWKSNYELEGDATKFSEGQKASVYFMEDAEQTVWVNIGGSENRTVDLRDLVIGAGKYTFTSTSPYSHQLDLNTTYQNNLVVAAGATAIFDRVGIETGQKSLFHVYKGGTLKLNGAPFAVYSMQNEGDIDILANPILENVLGHVLNTGTMKVVWKDGHDNWTDIGGIGDTLVGDVVNLGVMTLGAPTFVANSKYGNGIFRNDGDLTFDATCEPVDPSQIDPRQFYVETQLAPTGKVSVYVPVEGFGSLSTTGEHTVRFSSVLANNYFVIASTGTVSQGSLDLGAAKSIFEEAVEIADATVVQAGKDAYFYGGTTINPNPETESGSLGALTLLAGAEDDETTLTLGGYYHAELNYGTGQYDETVRNSTYAAGPVTAGAHTVFTVENGASATIESYNADAMRSGTIVVGAATSQVTKQTPLAYSDATLTVDGETNVSELTVHKGTESESTDKVSVDLRGAADVGHLTQDGGTVHFHEVSFLDTGDVSGGAMCIKPDHVLTLGHVITQTGNYTVVNNDGVGVAGYIDASNLKLVTDTAYSTYKEVKYEGETTRYQSGFISSGRQYVQVFDVQSGTLTSNDTIIYHKDAAGVMRLISGSDQTVTDLGPFAEGGGGFAGYGYLDIADTQYLTYYVRDNYVSGNQDGRTDTHTTVVDPRPADQVKLSEVITASIVDEKVGPLLQSVVFDQTDYNKNAVVGEANFNGTLTVDVSTDADLFSVAEGTLAALNINDPVNPQTEVVVLAGQDYQGVQGELKIAGTDVYRIDNRGDLGQGVSLLATDTDGIDHWTGTVRLTGTAENVYMPDLSVNQGEAASTIEFNQWTGTFRAEAQTSDAKIVLVGDDMLATQTAAITFAETAHDTTTDLTWTNTVTGENASVTHLNDGNLNLTMTGDTSAWTGHFLQGADGTNVNLTFKLADSAGKATREQNTEIWNASGNMTVTYAGDLETVGANAHVYDDSAELTLAYTADVLAVTGIISQQNGQGGLHLVVGDGTAPSETTFSGLFSETEGADMTVKEGSKAIIATDTPLLWVRGAEGSTVVVNPEETLTLTSNDPENSYSRFYNLDNQGTIKMEGNGGDIKLVDDSTDGKTYNLGVLQIVNGPGMAAIETSGVAGKTTVVNLNQLSSPATDQTLQLMNDNGLGTVDYNLGGGTAFAGGTIQFGSNGAGGDVNVVLNRGDVAANAVLQSTGSGSGSANIEVNADAAQMLGIDSTEGSTAGGKIYGVGSQRVATITGDGTYSYNGALGQNLDVAYTGSGRQTFEGGAANFSGKVTVDNDSPTQGILEILNASSVKISDLTIGASDTLDLNDGSNVGTAEVSGSVVAKGNQENGYSKLDGNLTLGSSATYDVSAAGGTGGLQLTGALTITQGAQLSTNDLAGVLDLGWFGMYDLAFDVTDMSSFGKDIDWSEGVDASTVFGNEALGGRTEEFYIRYSQGEMGGNGNNVGAVYIYRIPEPTTGTLSLLALCALAARRRRKH